MLLTNEKPASGLIDFLWLELTGKCNLTCSHCYAHSSPQGTHGAMQPADWERVLKEASELGCRRIQFIGGEPLLYPRIEHLVRFATSLHLNIEIYTNLVAVKADLWDFFEECQVSLATSFYSHNPAVHETITRGHNSFQRTVGNIEHALKRSFPLRIGLIEMREDQGLEETKRFLRDLGVKRIGHDRVRAVGRGESYVQVERREQGLCGACAKGKACIVPSGEVYPCVFSRWLAQGNVRQQSLKEIMYGDTMLATRRELQVFFDARSAQKRTSPHSQEECEPFCEPWDCVPNTPKCRPNHQCVPDWKVPCNPEAPCPPDEEKCPPDWDPE